MVAAADTIKIGVPVGLSGANSVVAPSVVQATELAVAQINSGGGLLGRQLEVVVADDGSGAQGAQKAFDSLVFRKKVDVLISMETSARETLVYRSSTAAGYRTFIRRSTKALCSPWMFVNA